MFLLFLLLVNPLSNNVLIYIPICFYYFQVGYKAIETAMIFTFQYVSIISILNFIFIPITSTFTFQYVSIISPLVLRTVLYHLNLHSNMFLLFRTIESCVENIHVHLHSNMFLLFRSFVCLNLFCAYPFTFQYVSIISETTRVS